MLKNENKMYDMEKIFALYHTFFNWGNVEQLWVLGFNDWRRVWKKRLSLQLRKH